MNHTRVKFQSIRSRECRQEHGIPYLEDLIATDCKDGTKEIQGLVCRDDFGYREFVEHPEWGDYLLRIIDDTYVNVTNLMVLIGKLNRIYNPKKELVFRGFRNDHTRGTFLGGGSGWLMSRPLVELHMKPEYSLKTYFEQSWMKQDDTTETIIIQKIYKDTETWSDYLWTEGQCENCDDAKFRVGDFSDIGDCDGAHIYPVNQLISVHQRGSNETLAAAKRIGTYPNDVYIYRLPGSQRIEFCRCPPNYISPSITEEYIRQHAEHLTYDKKTGKIVPFKC